jgi:hypothetical protein
MHSIIANADFTYEDIKLKDLRDRIIRENDLGILDIVKGFHDMSSFDLRYDDFKISENQKTDVRDIYTHFQELIETKVSAFIQPVYDAYYAERYAELKEAYDKSGITDITLDEIIKTDNKRKNPDEKRGFSSFSSAGNGNASFRDAYWHFKEQLTGRWNSTFERNITDKVNAYVTQLFTEYLQGTYENNEYMTEEMMKEAGITRCGLWGDNFPAKIDLNSDKLYDFSKIYVQAKEDSVFKDDITGHKNGNITYTNYLGEEVNFSVHVPTICVHIDRQIANDFFDKKIQKEVFKRMGTPSIFKYAQNLEAQPITINVNTKTGKCELIDGYKRLLLTMDEELLNISAPVRVFRDLDDKGFLALLYAANLWKKSSSGVKNTSFHDRGYLFALKTRFDFEIPKEYYESAKDDSHTQSQTLSGYRMGSDLDIFYTYDFGFTNTGSYAINGDNSLKDICKTEANHSFYDNLQEKVHLVNDMRFFYGKYQKIAALDYGYDSDIRNGIAIFIIRQVGRIRALGDTKNQNEIDTAMIANIFSNQDYVKAFSKKHFSTMTYVDNFLRDKGYYRKITQTLYDNLVSLNKEKLQDNEAEEDNDLEL